MKVFHSLSEAAELAGCAACLGNFDGVHLGHQALFAEARGHGTPVAITFHPHPGKVLQPELAPHLITTLERKLELLAECGLSAVVVQPFDRHFAALQAADFERALWDELGVRHAVVGGDFTYGARRQGNAETLRAAAASRGAQLWTVPAVAVEGVVVSSTRIREYLLEGRVEAARKLLGRPFDLDGVVVPGDGRGRTIGVPTANVDTLNELMPCAGVYAVRARVDEDPAWRAGAANIGVKPTFGGNTVTVEVHLLDFSGDLYGKTLRVQFLSWLRAEHRFASAAELTRQIRRDLDLARAAAARAEV